jgi:hypothetical protein
MSYYIIKETLTKEENLQAAKEYAEKAKEILNRFNEIAKEGNKLVPGRTFGLSKAKLEKLKTPNEVMERLLSASRSEYNTKSTYEHRERMVKEKEEKEKAEAFKKEMEVKQSELLNQAIAYCLENGRTFGDGLSVENAIQVANDIAFQKEVARKETEIGDGYIGFDGQNCEDECAGWNPQVSHRCECGNRRVSWTGGWSSDFRNMDIYAEAY